MGVESNEQKKMGFEQKKKMGVESNEQKKMGFERTVDQELIEECKKKDGG